MADLTPQPLADRAAPPPAPRCPSCGLAVFEGSQCSRCGSPLEPPPGRRPRSRRILTRLLVGGALLYLACIAGVAVGPRIPGQTGYYASPVWVRACFWTGLTLIPVLFVLFVIRGLMWFFDSLANARRPESRLR